MIHSYLENKSPQNKKNRGIGAKKSTKVISVTCRQIQYFEIKYDDIIYKAEKMEKIIICGIIIAIRDGKSPKGNPLKMMKVKDSTGQVIIQAYESKLWETFPKLMKQGKYVKICLNVKCMGTIKLQIKHTLVSLKVVKDINEMTSHFIQVIQDELQTQY